MEQHHHPDDERLAAFAAGEGEASLASHVDACDRCTALVADLASLRAALAALPDVAPSRPLRFLPPVAPEPERLGLGGLVRRLAAPAMAAGAALVLVGSVGMAASGSMAAPSAGSAGGAAEENAFAPDAAASAATAESGTPLVAAASPESHRDGAAAGVTAEPVPADTGGTDQLLAQESPAMPWLAITIAGAILLAASLILRWTVVPRAPDPPAYPGA